jgi:hypothetical protein
VKGEKEQAGRAGSGEERREGCQDTDAVDLQPLVRARLEQFERANPTHPHVPLLLVAPLSLRPVFIMSFSASRMLLRTPQIGRIAVRHASTTTEAASTASNAASKATTQASQGLSKVSSSAESGMSKAAGAATSAINSVGGRTGQVISMVQCT